MKPLAWFVVGVMILAAGCLEGAGNGEKNEPPVAKLVIGQKVVNLGEEVTFDGTTSTDDNRIVKYLFYFGDGRSSGELSVGLTSHVYDEAGNVTVTLVVWDDKGAMAIDSASLRINAPPEANMSITRQGGAPTSDAWVDETLTFSAAGSTDTDGYIRHFLWQFGDGTNSTLQEATHVYQANGTYIVNLTVEDNDGATDTVSTPITVRMHRFRATWNDTTTEQVFSDDGYLGDQPPAQNSTTYDIDVTRTNITRIWVNLTWEDDEIILTDPDQFYMEVTPPFGDTKDETSSSGSITLDWKRTFGGKEYPTWIFYAPNLQVAEDMAGQRNMTDTGGTGNYHIYLEITVNDVILDSGNAYHIEVWVEYYQGEPSVESAD